MWDFNITNELNVVSQHSFEAALAITIAAGTLYCFLGYRVIKFLVGLTGFILAGTVGAAIAGWFSEGNYVFMIPAACLGGMTGAIALLFVYKAGIFCLGLLGAALVAHSLLLPHPLPWMPLVVLGIGILGGGLALVLERPVITLATAALGGWLVVHAIGFFIIGKSILDVWQQPDNTKDIRWILLITWAAISLAGAFAQFSTYKGRLKPPMLKTPGA